MEGLADATVTGVGVLSAMAAVGAEEFPRALAFYIAILGREPDLRIGDGYAEFHLPGLRLAVFRPKAARAEDFRNPIGRRVGLGLVLYVSDLAKATADVERLGGSATAVFDAAHGRECHAYDPDGNRLILVEGLADQ